MDVNNILYNSIFLFVIFLLTIYWYVRRHYSYWERRGVDYVKPIPFVGNMGFLMRRSVHDFFLDLKKKYPMDYVGIFLGMKPALVIQNTKLAKNILVKDASIFQDRYTYSSDNDTLGSLNLFNLKSQTWSKMRHEISPMFTSSRLKMICELMNQNATELVKKVQRDYVDGRKDVNLKELFSMYTSDTVAYSVFGLRVSVLKDGSSPLWLITCSIVKWTFWRGFEFITIFLLPSLAALLRLKFFSATATDYVRKLFWNVVEDRESTRTDSDKDLVNHLLKLRENMKLPGNSDPKLVDNLMLAQAAVFILGSVETSSTTLCYIFHELAHHPEEQEKLYRAVDDALTQKGKDILDFDDLLDVKYLGACIYETFRKHPPLAYLDRVCTERYKISDKLTVEPGIPLLINVAAFHHDKDMFPEPTKWQPDRAAVASSDNDNLQYHFLPFGEGPRFCIGKRYGILQVRAALAQLIHKYEILPGPGPYEAETDPYSLITTPRNGGCVRFVPRNKT